MVVFIIIKELYKLSFQFSIVCKKKSDGFFSKTIYIINY